MKISLVKYICAIFVGIACAIPAGAQSMTFMGIGNDVETMGLGYASIAAGASGGVVENNIAAAALYEDGYGMADLGYTLWQPSGFNTGIVGIGGFSKIGKRLAVGVSGKYLIEQPYLMMEANGLTSDMFRPKEGMFGVGVACRIIDGLAVGANFKLGASGIAPEASATVFAADIHAMYSIKGVNIGVGVSNLGTKADYGYGGYDIPMLVRAGASYSIFGLTVSAEADYQFTLQTEGYEAKKEKTMEQAAKRLQEMGAGGLLAHGAEKLRLTWSEGYCIESTWYNVKAPGTVYDFSVGARSGGVQYLCQVFRVLLFAGLLWASCRGLLTPQLLDRRRSGGKISGAFLMTAFLGAIAFYLLWESGQRYSLSFIPWLNIGAAAGLAGWKKNKYR